VELDSEDVQGRLETNCWLPHGYECQQIGLFQASAEDVPVSMSGCLVTADSTSEVGWGDGGYSKAGNIYVIKEDMRRFGLSRD